MVTLTQILWIKLWSFGVLFLILTLLFKWYIWLFINLLSLQSVDHLLLSLKINVYLCFSDPTSHFVVHHPHWSVQPREPFYFHLFIPLNFLLYYFCSPAPFIGNHYNLFDVHCIMCIIYSYEYTFIFNKKISTYIQLKDF